MLRAGDSGGVLGGVPALSHFAQPALVLISPESWECRLRPGREKGNHRQGERKCGDFTKASAQAAVPQTFPLRNEVRG